MAASRMIRSSVMIIFLFGLLTFAISTYLINLLTVNSKGERRLETDVDLNKKCLHLKKRLPQCIIIGVAKCGTGALRQFLNVHPDIVPQEMNHGDFFDFNYHRGLEFHRQRMPYSCEHEVTFEGSPRLYNKVWTARRIHSMNSSIKLILAVRDPVIRLISHYTMYRLKGNLLEQAPFESVVLDVNGKVDTNYSIVQRSLYHLYFDEWIKYFPKSQIHIVDGANLIRNPFHELYKIETFLGLKHKFDESMFVFNKTKGFYCVYKEDLTPLCLGRSKGVPHVTVDKKVMAILYDFFREKNNRFFKQINRTFEWKQ